MQKRQTASRALENIAVAESADDGNGHLSLANRLLLQELGERLGLTLSMPDGAVRLSMDDGPDWFLEITEDGAMWIIHAEICKCVDTTPAMLDAYLRLNGQIALMRGAAVCIESSSDTVRLYTAIDTERLHIEMLESAFSRLMLLYREQAILIRHF